MAAELEDSAWDRFQELNEQGAEGLPPDGYDIMDSLRHNPDLAPLLVTLQGDADAAAGRD